MPRNTKKKFQKFLEARQHRRKKRIDNRSSPLLWFDVFCAILTPVLMGAVVLLLWNIGALYILYPILFLIAFCELVVWGALAYRGSKGFWSNKFDVLFGVSFVVFIGFGACWGFDQQVPVKAWVTAPDYARLPIVQLEMPAGRTTFQALEGSTIHVTWNGEEPAPSVLLGEEEQDLESSVGVDVSSTLAIPVTGKNRDVQLVLRRGWHKLALWNIDIVPDRAPQVALLEEPEITLRKTIKFVYKALDDHGVQSVSVRIAPTSSSTGNNTEPVEIQLMAPSLAEIENASYADLTALPWAGVPVTAQLVVTDGTGQRGWSEPKVITLPTRTFRNPFARALIEERQKFLENPDVTTRDELANVMAGIARQQGLYRGDPVVLMSLRAGAVRLVLNDDPQTPQAVSEILWKTALRLEEGHVGQARSALAEAERDLTFSIMREASSSVIGPLLGRVHDAMTAYFDALEDERTRQPPALQEMDWPLATASEMLTPEDLQARLAMVAEWIENGDRDAARNGLAQLQVLIENLRTTPPELTPQQAQLAQQVFALRALVRGQKNLNEEIEKLGPQKATSAQTKKTLQSSLARGLAQQQLLLSALRDVIARQGLAQEQAKNGEDAMRKAILALQQMAVDDVRKNQIEALVLLESSLSALTEQMRRSMTAKAP